MSRTPAEIARVSICEGSGRAVVIAWEGLITEVSWPTARLSMANLGSRLLLAKQILPTVSNDAGISLSQIVMRDGKFAEPTVI